MFSNQIVIALVALLMQQTQAETRPEAIASIKEQIGLASAGIDLSIANSRRLLGQSRSQIGLALGEAQDAVSSKLGQLDLIIGQAKEEAQQSGKDVNACVNPAEQAVRALDSAALGNCANSAELNGIGLVIGSLSQLKRQLSVALPLCEKSPSVEELRQCAVGRIAEVKREASRIQGNINETLKIGRENAESCINNNLQLLDGKINDIARQLKQCLQNVL